MKNVNGLKICLIFLVLTAITPTFGFYASNRSNLLKSQEFNNKVNLRSASSEYEVIRITYNDVYDNLGYFDDGLITYVSAIYGSMNKEIFLYNVFTGVTTRLTYNDYDDTQPRINNGLITWIGNVDGDYEIFLYDTHLSSPEVVRITYNDWDDFTPIVDDGLITWRGGGYVWLYDYNTQESIRIAGGLNPKVQDGLVTWDAFGDIWLYDYNGALGTARQIIRVTSDSFQNYYPWIDSGLIVFHSNWEIDTKTIVKLYLYNCFTGETIHVGDPKYTYSAMVQNGLVVYGGQDPEGPDGDEEIYLYNYATGITTQITFNDVYDEAPMIDNGIIAWSRTYKIFIYNTVNGETTMITDRLGSGFSVLINNGLLTWSSNRYSGGTGDYEIYYARPASFTAEFNLDPDTLNLKCKGKWVTAYIEFPVEYNVEDIDVSTMLLQNSIPAELSPTCIGDHDGDGVPDLMVKFDRASLQSLVSVGDSVEISLSGSLTNGLCFSAVDTIKVIDQGNEHVDEGDPSSIT